MIGSRTALASLLGLVACGGSDAERASSTAAPAAEPAAAAAPVAAAAPAAVERQAAPDFTLPDVDGTPVSLASFRGKTVVLEWFNPGCPFVVYAHGDGPLKAQPVRATEGGVVWLAINSGKTAVAASNKDAIAKWGIGYPVLLDADGAVGKAYGAKSTPHMFVIDPAGKIAYRGALDDAPRGAAPTAGGVNYVDQALAALAAGTEPATAETAAYGCSVKYAD